MVEPVMKTPVSPPRSPFQPRPGRLLPIALQLLLGTLPAVEALAQHDGARNAVREIARHLEGKPADVAGALAKQRPDAGPAETAFVEMLHLLSREHLDQAFAKAQEAVELGLPPERLSAGPRLLLRKLHAHPPYRIWERELQPSPLVHGPMVGSVTDRSASFWVRTSRSANVTFVVQDREETVFTTAEGDFTATATISGLKPGTGYPYRILIDGIPLQRDGLEFTTYPERGTSASFAVGFGGGAGFIPDKERMWDTIRSFAPRAFFLLGDNVYIDDPNHPLTQDYCYYRRQSRPEWRRLTATTPMYAIYDDHDFGTNDCVPGPRILEPAWKRPVWERFRRNWVNPAYGGGWHQPGCWHDFMLGDVHFILLDGRYYRDRKSGSMLGPVQKRWLKETLRRSEGTFKVIASPVPFTPGVKPGSPDPWDGYPEEREELFSFIASEGLEGVFLIAADRHRTDLRTIAREGTYDLYEFESSRLTNRHTHKVVSTPGLVWGYNRTCSFGLLRFDTTAEDPAVTFEAIDIDGNTVHSHTLLRSRLR